MTTCHVIPLISDFGEQDEKRWLNALQFAFDNLPIESGGAGEVEYQVISHRKIDEALKSHTKVAIISNPEVATLEEYPNLVWVQNLWAGVDKLLPIMQSRSFNVVRMHDKQLAVSMSESVLLWVLNLYRDMPAYRDQQSIQQWQQLPAPLSHECTVSVLGLGELGKMSATRLRDNGFNVLGWSRTPKQIVGIETLTGESGLDNTLSRSDIVVVLLPLTEKTNGLLSANKLKLLKKSASIINFARGPILPEKDLLFCLDLGNLKYVVLDVFEQEPLPDTSPLWFHPKITVLPHISAVTHPKSASKVVAENIIDYFVNDKIPDFVKAFKEY